MRRRPPRDPTPLPLHEALKAHLGSKDLLGHPYRLGAWGIKLIFGRRHEFFSVTSAIPIERRKGLCANDVADLLYDHATRALDRRLRKLGWE